MINELSRRLFSESSTSPIGAIRDIDSVDLTKFRFYDVSRDGRVTALDALRVINQLARQSVSGGEGVEGEQVGLDLTGHVGVGPDLSWQRPGSVSLDPGGLARTGPGLRMAGSSTSGRVSASAVATRGDTDDAPRADNSNPPSSLSASLVDSALQTLWLE